MWMLRPLTKPREVTIDLPPLLVESLGVGAEVLANYLTALADAAANEPDKSKHPTPNLVLCRICERQIMPWWFEKHSELCLQEHWAEMDVQIAQENLNEHRNVIVKVLDTLEAQQNNKSSGIDSLAAVSQAEYKGLPIGPSPSPSGSVSTSSSAPGTPPRSRDTSFSGSGGARWRSSFAVRRPLARIVELVLDLCDTALEINTPAIKETRRSADDAENFRSISPHSESQIAQVLQWQSPSSNTLEQEQGLAALAADTEQASRAKAEAVIRHRKIVEYAERIRIEYTLLVDECITGALSKAERIAAGQLTDSSSSAADPSDEDVAAPEQAASSQSRSRSQSEGRSEITDPPSTSALTMSIRDSQNARRQSQFLADGKSSMQAVSTASNSPMEHPAPRSRRSLAGFLGSSQSSRRSLLADSDAGETSDSSAPPSILPGTVRTESPSSERSLESKRKSLVLTGMSPRRQASPVLGSGPHSPLRLPKPRLSTGTESLPSPVTSPSANMGEMPSSHDNMHHRRQSSTASSDALRAMLPPSSPHLSTVSQPQPRPAPPSIKDFEVIKPISKGAFGSVYLSKKKTTGEYFAIKVLKKADMIAKNQVTNVKAERAIMMWQGESDFVAKLYWTFSSKDYLYLVMEYLNGGDCASLVKVLGELPEDWTKKYIAEVVLGVQHLHSRGIVHRDLKPDNLLIDQTGHLKLTDFGLSRMGLIGRQKHALKSGGGGGGSGANTVNESTPDFFRQAGSFRRGTSVSSSRSTSVDYQGSAYSPGSTPLMTPDVISSSLSQPTYFNLNHSGLGLSRQNSLRRTSDYRSDSGVSDSYRSFSLHEDNETPVTMPLVLSNSATEDEGQSETAESPQLYPLHHISSNQSAPTPGQHNVAPQQLMQPPLMALIDPEDHSRRFVGTPDYLAPETLNGVGQDEMSDWWSLGCIMFEFLFGYPPFNAPTPDEVFDNILHRRIHWPDEPEELVSKEAVDLMNKLIVINPQERLGANVDERFADGGAEIRSHPWFSDINFETLLEDKAQFVPNLENPEDTDYFDGRGATLQAFTEEVEDQQSTPAHAATARTATGATAAGAYPERPHDALSKVRSQGSSGNKRPVMPLHIPPHVREVRNRRLSEPVITDDFGNFTFKNLPVLERANKDVIQKLRQEALQTQQRQASVSGAPPSANNASLEGSQISASQAKLPINRAPSPSGMSQGNSSPSRLSQPSSPLLVQFSTGTGNNHERRKTSGSSSTSNSLQSSGSSMMPPPSLDQTRSRLGSATMSSPTKAGRSTPHSPDKSMLGKGQQQQQQQQLGSGGVPIGRSRSHTLGSQDDGEQLSSSSMSSSLPREGVVPGRRNRRNQLLDVSPSSSDNEDPRAKALLKVQRRRQSSRRLSRINVPDGPYFRPLDVLICEDHPVSRIVMERLFEKLRCRTITATNGAEGVRYALGEVQFDIIMTEVKLPQLNGPDFARMVRETRSVNRTTPIIAVTGYLKDLPETHYFDELMEKPPTLLKLTDTLGRFCQWKPPPNDYSPSQVPVVPQVPPSFLRRSVPPVGDSPASTSSSSGFTHLPPSLYHGSSRPDSVGSSVSYFGDMDSIKAEDSPFVIGHQNEEWVHGSSPSGLGLTEEKSSSTGTIPFPPFPRTPSLAPSPLEAPNTLSPRKQRSSSERVKRGNSFEGNRPREYSESGDDEDEELGDVQVRARSPRRSRSQRPGSKLGIEMMRTNSRGSIVYEESSDKKEHELESGDDSKNPPSAEEGHGDDEKHRSTSDAASSGLEEQFEQLRIPEASGEEDATPGDNSSSQIVTPPPERSSNNPREAPPIPSEPVTPTPSGAELARKNPATGDAVDSNATPRAAVPGSSVSRPDSEKIPRSSTMR